MSDGDDCSVSFVLQSSPGGERKVTIEKLPDYLQCHSDLTPFLRIDSAERVRVGDSIVLADVSSEVERYVATKVKPLVEKNVGLARDNNELNARVAALEHELSSSNSELLSMNSNFEDIGKAFSAMQSQMQSQMSTMQLQTQSQMSTMQLQIDTLQSENATLRKEMDQLTKKVNMMSSHSLVYYTALATEILTRFAKGAQPYTSSTGLFQNLPEWRKSSLRRILSSKGEDLDSFIFEAEALVDERNNRLHFVKDLDKRVEQALKEEGIVYLASDREYKFAHFVFSLFEDIRDEVTNCVSS